jgi:hypothetical protein
MYMLDDTVTEMVEVGRLDGIMVGVAESCVGSEEG